MDRSSGRPPPIKRQGYSTLHWIKPAGDTEWRQVWLKTPEDRIRQAVDAVLLQAGYDPDDDPHYPGNPDLLERLRQQRRQLIDHYSRLRGQAKRQERPGDQAQTTADDDRDATLPISDP